MFCHPLLTFLHWPLIVFLAASLKNVFVSYCVFCLSSKPVPCLQTQGQQFSQFTKQPCQYKYELQNRICTQFQLGSFSQACLVPTVQVQDCFSPALLSLFSHFILVTSTPSGPISPLKQLSKKFTSNCILTSNNFSMCV